MATEDEVRAASQTFYVALNRMLNGEASALGDIWSHGATVTTMHPIGGREMGWDKVRETWEQVAKQASAGNVQLNDQHIQASGDMACEVGTEKGQFTLGRSAGLHRASRHQCLSPRVPHVEDRPSPHGHVTGDDRCGQPPAEMIGNAVQRSPPCGRPGK